MRWSSHAQQAPDAVHSLPVAPVKSALKNAQSKKGTRAEYSMKIAKTVSVEFNTLLKRFCLIQDANLIFLIPGELAAGIAFLLFLTILSLNQFNFSVVPVHK